jgi:hypothetical protein
LFFLEQGKSFFFLCSRKINVKKLNCFKTYIGGIEMNINSITNQNLLLFNSQKRLVQKKATQEKLDTINTMNPPISSDFALNGYASTLKTMMRLQAILRSGHEMKTRISQASSSASSAPGEEWNYKATVGGNRYVKWNPNLEIEIDENSNQINCPHIQAKDERYYYEAARAVEKKYQAAAASNRSALKIFGTGPVGDSDFKKINSFVSLKYSDPHSPHFIKCIESRQATISNETRVTAYGHLGTSFFGEETRFKSIDMRDPLFSTSTYDWLDDKGNYAYAGKIVGKQISSIFKLNNIVVPFDTFLSFSINPYDFSVSVTGTDDENLISMIESVLTQAENGMALFQYVLTCEELPKSSLAGRTFEQKEQLNKFFMSNYVRNHANVDMRDVSVVDGRFLTADGRDLINILRERIYGNEVAERDWSFIKGQLDHFAKVGYNSVPSFNLQIGWLNNEIHVAGNDIKNLYK